MNSKIHNFSIILKQMLYNDRFFIFFWVIGLAIANLVVCNLYQSIFNEPAYISSFVLLMENPLYKAMLGAISQGVTTTAQLFSGSMTIFMSLITAMMSIFLVNRNMRDSEEKGKHDLLLANVLGRYSIITAVIIEVLIVFVLLTTTTVLAINISSITSNTLGGDFNYAISVASTFVLFAMITLAVNQLFESAKITSGISLIILFSIYILRGFSDVFNDKISSIFPLTWSIIGKAYLDNNYFGIFLNFLFALVFIIVAIMLYNKRDLKAGVITLKASKAKNNIMLNTLPTTIIYQCKWLIIVWLYVLVAIGIMYGYFFNEVDVFFQDNPALNSFLSFNSSESILIQFATLLVSIMAIVASIQGILIIYKIKTEELNSYIENIYSRKVSRNRYLLSYFLIALLFTTITYLCGVLSLSFMINLVTSEGINVVEVLKAALIHIPFIYVLISIATFLYSAFIHRSSLIWLYLGFCFFIRYFKGFLNIPDYIANFSILYLLPDYPIEPLNITLVLLYLCISIAIFLIALKIYVKRDIVKE
ncbi:ABC transporter permease [Mycoplasma sp. P36-A1]|uniref:ABC transporter permease n=1 Tax=Mycoplasma sp. P36-A1 TaxID=3252900 RepID=UPI003C2AD77E